MFTLRHARANLWPGDPSLSPACSPSCCANTLCVLELGDRWKLAQKKNILFLSGSCLAFDAGMHTNRYSWGGSRMQWRDGYKQHKLELGTDRYSKRTRDQHRARNLCLHTWLHSPHPIPCRKKWERARRGESRNSWTFLLSSLLMQQHGGSRVVFQASFLVAALWWSGWLTLPPLCWCSSLCSCVVNQIWRWLKKSSTLPIPIIFTLAQRPGTIHLLPAEVQLEQQHWRRKGAGKQGSA